MLDGVGVAVGVGVGVAVGVGVGAGAPFTHEYKSLLTVGMLRVSITSLVAEFRIADVTFAGDADGCACR